MTFLNEIKEYLPYIFAIISGVGSYIAACKSARNEMNQIKENNRHDLERLMEQHKVDIDSLERAHQLEIEKMKLAHQHELELKSKDAEMQFGSLIVTEAMKMPEVRQQISQGVRNSGKKKK